MKRIRAVILAVLLIWPIYSGVAYAEGLETEITATAYEACVNVGKQYHIAPEFLMAIVEIESAGKANATNGTCKGLMQINAKYHADRMRKLGVTDLYDAESNILVGADYLVELMEQYEDVAYVLDRYNGNSNADYNYHHGIVSDYADRVLTRTKELERIHECISEDTK